MKGKSRCCGEIRLWEYGRLEMILENRKKVLKERKRVGQILGYLKQTTDMEKQNFSQRLAACED